MAVKYYDVEPMIGVKNCKTRSFLPTRLFLRGFVEEEPARNTHSSLEVCDLADLAMLARLLAKAIGRIGKGFSLDRDDYPQ
jgi:hypothetical protein